MPETNTSGKKLNVTRAIRQYLKKRPAAKPEEIAEWLAKKGIQVSPIVVAALLTAIKAG